MNYWWVNQKQTYRQEIAGGFMWSPKRNQGGGANPYYDFMTQVKPGDIVFSYAIGQVIAVGAALSTAITSNKPSDFGRAGEVWSDEGWKVEVDFRRVDNPIFPSLHMHLLAPLLPSKYSPIRPDGKGNQVYLTSISQEMGLVLLQLLGNPEIEWPITKLSELKYSEEEQELILNDSMTETMKTTLILARRGQGAFRERVRFFEQSCRVTGVNQAELLIASHIKPWRVANNEERLNGHNGLFLSPHIDKLFDSGLISFESSGRLLVSGRLDKDVLKRWKIDPKLKVKKFGVDQDYFLEFHRAEVFHSS